MPSAASCMRHNGLSGKRHRTILTAQRADLYNRLTQPGLRALGAYSAEVNMPAYFTLYQELFV
jgi:hypothetical protein